MPTEEAQLRLQLILAQQKATQLARQWADDPDSIGIGKDDKLARADCIVMDIKAAIGNITKNASDE